MIGRFDSEVVVFSMLGFSPLLAVRSVSLPLASLLLKSRSWLRLIEGLSVYHTRLLL